ncbi:divalent-cation tolerance protein CutA [Spectribacter hydrogenoxidans]|uniref:Divalent-cation tolerance protein CutA n=1 Tax=Spectribacter hydrogenoxidans TaxID=3075608 RepID=A0ABU3C084_9GAMM|nr:divalent-cation tolerance protein CutA [Salinisphaera sp. W335]MDT0634983.1 divalent-cation tolerance protein CutA [Salinisphaera sp. W335]
MTETRDTAVYVVYVTCPAPAVASEISRTLVDEHLAACVNVVPGLQSVYHWQGQVEVDEELLLLIKTTADRFESLKARVLTLHPDELPEILAVRAADGLDGYLRWVKETTEPA